MMRRDCLLGETGFPPQDTSTVKQLCSQKAQKAIVKLLQAQIATWLGRDVT